MTAGELAATQTSSYRYLQLPQPLAAGTIHLESDDGEGILDVQHLLCS
jgi:hypothetical protein